MITKTHLVSLIALVLLISYVESNSHLNIKYRHILTGNQPLTKLIAK